MFDANSENKNYRTQVEKLFYEQIVDVIKVPKGRSFNVERIGVVYQMLNVKRLVFEDSELQGTRIRGRVGSVN